MTTLAAEQLSLTIAKSSKLATTLPISIISHLQRCVGEDFEISEKGLTITPGATLSTDKVSSLIAFLGTAGEQGKVATGLINLALGDAILLARAAYGDAIADELIQHAICERGQSKHTVQEAERTVKFMNELFPDRNDRPTNLSYSHYSELKSGALNHGGEFVVPKEKVIEVVKEVEKGHLVNNVVTQEGESKETRVPLSCKETRSLINEARPEELRKKKADKKPEVSPPAAPQSTEKKIRFLYISKEDHSDVVYSTESYLDDDLLTDEFIILDLECKEVLNPEKEAIAAFTEI